MSMNPPLTDAEWAKRYPAEPALVYPEKDGTFTTGHSGTDTSRERAIQERESGAVARRQAGLTARLQVRGERGITVKELRDVTEMHHGQASALLSNMHQAGLLAMLEEKRDRCHVYVLPDHVADRPVLERKVKSSLAIPTAEDMAERDYQTWRRGYLFAEQMHADDPTPEADLRSLYAVWGQEQ